MQIYFLTSKGVCSIELLFFVWLIMSLQSKFVYKIIRDKIRDDSFYYQGSNFLNK